MDRHDSEEPGKLEIPRSIGGCSNCGRCDDDTQPNLRIHRGECTRGPSGKCDGCRNRAYDERRECPVAALRNRCRDCYRIDSLQGAGIGLCTGNVHPYRPQPPSAHRWRCVVDSQQYEQGQESERGKERKGHTHRVRIHRWRCANGSCECSAQVRRCGPYDSCRQPLGKILG